MADCESSQLVWSFEDKQFQITNHFMFLWWGQWIKRKIIFLIQIKMFGNVSEIAKLINLYEEFKTEYWITVWLMHLINSDEK